jgi:diguanylate cyclase (GGDEF)-like protein/PAS domain S-box-containing protein
MMNPQLQSRQRSVLRSISAIASSLLVIMGSLVLAGWICDIPLLKSVSPAWVSMKVNTAVCFVLNGLSLWCLRDEQATLRVRRLGQGCAALVMLIALPTLGEYLLAADFGIDQLLMLQPAAAADPATRGRMSGATAIGFLLTALALLGLDWKNRRGHRPVLALALLVAVIGLLAIAGYTYGVKSLHAFSPFSSIAVHTAALFIVISIGILCARPERGPLGILTADGIGSTMARRILPLAIILPFLIGWLRMRGEQQGFYGFEFGLALFATSNAIMFALLIWITGVSLNRGDADRKRAEEALRDSEEQYRQMVNLSPDSVTIHQEGRWVFANPATARILGVEDPSQLIGRSLLDFMHPDVHQHVQERWEQIYEEKRHLDPTELKMIRPDGTLVYLETHVAPLVWEGRPAAQVVARDITERKRAAAATALLSAIVESSDDAIIGKDLNGIITSWNTGAERIFGYAASEIVGRSILLLIPRDRQEEEEEILKRLRRGKRIDHFETVRMGKEGRSIEVSVTVSAIKDSSGKIVGASKIAQDITARKQAEEALRASEAQLRSFVDQAPVSIAMFDGNMIYLAASRRWVADYGRGHHDLVGLSHYEVLPDMPEEWRQIHRKGLAGEAQRCDEELWIQADGTRNWLRWVVQPWRDVHGVLGGIMILTEDITQGKRIEEEIRETKNFLASIFDNIPNSIFIKDARDLRFVRVNAACERLTGYPEKEFLGKSDYDFFPKEQADFFVAKDRETLAGSQRVFVVEETITSRDGTQKILLTKKFPMLDKDGHPQYLLGMSEDITERKRAEEALLRFRMAMESSNEGIFLMDFETFRYLDVNETGCRMLGYSREELLTMRTMDTNLSLTEGGQRRRFEEARSLGSDHVMTEPEGRFMQRKDGTTFPIEAARRYLRVGDQEIVVGIARDITERKKIEEEVRETRNFLASVFDNIPNMISVKDARDLRFVRLNSAGEKLIGRSEQELLGKSDHDFFPKDQADFFVARDRETLASGGALFVSEEALTVKDGTTKLLQTKKLPIFDTDGSPKYLLAISEDITERQRATHALATERTLLRTLVDAMPDAIYTKDTASRFTMGNQAAFRHSGLATEAEIIGKSAFDFYPRAIAENYQADDIKVVAGETVLNREEASVNAEGVENWFLTTKVPLRDHAGKIVGIVGISRDITQRKVAEQQLRESEAKYRQLIEQASDGIFISDAEGNFLIANSRSCELLGYSEGELIGLNGKVTYLDEEKEIHSGRMEAVVAGQILRFERTVRRKDGTAFPAEVSIKMLDNGTVQVIFHDITERRNQEQKIARLSRIHEVLSGINSAIVRIRDRQELFEEACRIAVEHGGFSIALIALLDHVSGTLMLVAQAGLPIDLHAGGDSSSRSIGLLPRGVAEVALREKGPAFDNDIENKPDLLNGEIGPDTLNVRRAAVRLGAKSVVVLPLFVEGQTFGILTLFTPERNFFDDAELKLLSELAGDISFSLEFIAKEEKVDYLAYYDSLTGLPNRSLFFDRLTHQIGTAAREHSNVALVLMDLDRFRLINDTLGRQAGDALIGAVAHRIRETFRDQDTLARVGADSFAVAVSGTWKAPDAAHFLEAHNQQMFGEPFVLGREELRVSATAGIAVFPGDGDSPETLFANAEAALRKAKEENARFLFYSPDMNARVADSLRLENKLRQALENGEMVLWYQPKVDVKTRKLAGFEALMRWQDPETGMVAPAKFIPLMEQTGLILEAGRWALLQVARDCRLWVTNGIKPPRIAVNVSPIQLRQKNFVATIVEATEKAEEAGALLDLEITESVIMENVETIIPILQTVRGLGVEIAVDDFGTGYSSLAYIARLPIQALKIDRSFVVGMTQSQDSLAIVRSVISLAHSLRLHVIAEGVETEEQAALLLQLDCDQMQGYLFSRPVPPGEVPALVRKLTQA